MGEGFERSKPLSASLLERLGLWSNQKYDFFVDRQGDVIQTERALALLFRIARLALLLIILYGIYFQYLDKNGSASDKAGHIASATANGLTFVMWALGIAMGAWLCGALLGFLFGLPSVVEIRISDGDNQQGSGNGYSTMGYRESTNLEQVADWLTKIVIGLALTQYIWLQQSFERAFILASDLMTGGEIKDATPAAIIAIAFAVNGFLIAYLLMRRYFIREMVAGQTETKAKIDAWLKAKQDAGLVQQTSVTKEAAQQATDARTMAKTAANLAPTESVDAAKEIVEQVTGKIDYPDDPWREKFGNTAADCTLTATVSPIATMDQFFSVNLIVKATDPAVRTGQSVTFYLHPTFGPDPKKVAFGPDGTATLELIAYGAFTVGVLLEDGGKLELNLATLSEAPELFRLR